MQSSGVHQTTELTESQRNQAQRHIRRYSWFNGIAITCVMDNVLLLWALRNGLSAPLVAVLSSFAFLSMPFMLLGRQLSATLGLVRAWSLCWFLRYVFVLIMVPVPLLRGSGVEAAIPMIITACTFLLFAFRSIGMVNVVPLIGAITMPTDVGSFQAGMHLRNHIAHFASLLVVIGILRHHDEVETYQVLLTLACVAGFVSVYQLRHTPEPGALRLGARFSLRKIADHIAGRKSLRRLAMVWGSAATLIALTVPISMLALKNGYGISDDAVLAFTLLELIGVILAASLVSIASDHSGPRPLIILGMMLFTGTSLFWAFAPSTFFLPGVAIAFLLSGIAKGTLMLSLNHYLLASSRAGERFGVGLFMHIASGAASGVSAILIAGGLLSLLTPHLGEGLPLYHTYYRLILALTLAITLFTILCLPRLKDWTVRNVIGLIFSFADIRTLITLNRLRQTSSDDEDAVGLDQLTALASRHSERLLREFLESGRLLPQARAIQALGRIQFGNATAQILIREVREGAFTNGWRAAELLGQRRITEAIPALRDGLQSEDPYLLSKCMVALARLQDHESAASIRDLFITSTNPRVIIHGAHAIEILRDPTDVVRLLEKYVSQPWTSLVRDEILLAAASLCGRKRHVYRFLKTTQGSLTGSPSSDDTPADLPKELTPFLALHPWNEIPEQLRGALSAMAPTR